MAEEKETKDGSAEVSDKAEETKEVEVNKKFKKLVEEIEKMIPDEHIFWSLVFLRIALPVDVLSYALGALTTIRLRVYLLATLIGIVPFAFIFAYAAKVSIEYQIIAGAIGFSFVIIAYRKFIQKTKSSHT